MEVEAVHRGAFFPYFIYIG